jgi:hypothetical protein
MKKGKYDYWNWLLFTQLYEIYRARTKKNRAMELCDLISSAMQDMERLGFNPVDVFEERASAKAGQFRGIVRKYRRKFGEVIDDMRTEDTKTGRR